MCIRDRSKQAAAGRALVAGDLSPTGLFLSPMGETSFRELVDIYTPQAAGLEEAGVDLFVIETMMTLSDARAAVLAVRSVSDKPIFVTFTCDEKGRTVSGTDITAALVIMQGMGVDAFGLNLSLIHIWPDRPGKRRPYRGHRPRRDGAPGLRENWPGRRLCHARPY